MEELGFDIQYLRLLSEKYPNISAASNHIIKLQAFLNLPKGTEHFVSDLHGEYESFLHILKNGSGVIKLKIDELFSNSVSEKERKSLAALIYYPEEKLEVIKQTSDDLRDFYKITLFRLVEICKLFSAKYTRAYLREFIPEQYEPIIDELLYYSGNKNTKPQYFESIICSIIDTDMAEDYIIAISRLISRMAINRLHIIGDIYDRGPGADIILEALMDYHSVDIQWGNHDMLWMGAASGNKACIATVVRICTRYDNLHTLEDGYGISTRPLVTFAMNVYKDDPCTHFYPKQCQADAFNTADEEALAKVHKAITIIQFKLDGQMALKHPEYDMDHYRYLEKIDYEKGTITLEGKTYELNEANFPTIDPKDPYHLTEDEWVVMRRLKTAFTHSEKLQKHVRFLYSQGSMYNCYNNNLLFHGCIPLEEDGSFTKVPVGQTTVSGRTWLDYLDRMARQGHFGKKGSPEKEKGEDFFWYLWCGEHSPLFGKKKMTTFERYFIDDEETWKEPKNPYYTLMDDEQMCYKILDEFGLPHTGHVINGHVPVRKGESPIRANGRLLVIDGGLSRAYQKTTGIAGYTLVYDSYGMMLSAHEPFVSTARAIEEERDIHSTIVATERGAERLMVRDSDTGKEMQNKIDNLNLLLDAYHKGIIKERTAKHGEH